MVPFSLFTVHFYSRPTVPPLTVRSLAPICSSTTSTIFSELIFMQSHRARHRQRKKTAYLVIILGPSSLLLE